MTLSVNRRKFLWILALSLSPILSARATTVEPFNSQRLLDEAPIIVHGTVLQIQVGRGGRRMALLQAREVLRSPQPYRERSEFRIPLRNRVSPDGLSAYRVALAPEFRVGEEVVAFLVPLSEPLDPEAHFDLLGFHQGKFRVVSDTSGVRRVLAWNQAPEAPTSDTELLRQRQSTARLQVGRSSQQLPQISAEQARSLMTLDELLNRARSP